MPTFAAGEIRFAGSNGLLQQNRANNTIQILQPDFDHANDLVDAILRDFGDQKRLAVTTDNDSRIVIQMETDSFRRMQVFPREQEMVLQFLPDTSLGVKAEGDPVAVYNQRMNNAPTRYDHLDVNDELKQSLMMRDVTKIETTALDLRKTEVVEISVENDADARRLANKINAAYPTAEAAPHWSEEQGGWAVQMTTEKAANIIPSHVMDQLGEKLGGPMLTVSATELGRGYMESARESLSPREQIQSAMENKAIARNYTPDGNSIVQVAVDYDQGVELVQQMKILDPNSEAIFRNSPSQGGWVVQAPAEELVKKGMLRPSDVQALPSVSEAALERSFAAKVANAPSNTPLGILQSMDLTPAEQAALSPAEGRMAVNSVGKFGPEERVLQIAMGTEQEATALASKLMMADPNMGLTSRFSGTQGEYITQVPLDVAVKAGLIDAVTAEQLPRMAPNSRAAKSENFASGSMTMVDPTPPSIEELVGKSLNKPQVTTDSPSTMMMLRESDLGPAQNPSSPVQDSSVISQGRASLLDVVPAASASVDMGQSMVSQAEGRNIPTAAQQLQELIRDGNVAAVDYTRAGGEKVLQVAVADKGVANEVLQQLKDGGISQGLVRDSITQGGVVVEIPVSEAARVGVATNTMENLPAVSQTAVEGFAVDLNAIKMRSEGSTPAIPANEGKVFSVDVNPGQGVDLDQIRAIQTEARTQSPPQQTQEPRNAVNLMETLQQAADKGLLFNENGKITDASILTAGSNQPANHSSTRETPTKIVEYEGKSPNTLDAPHAPGLSKIGAASTGAGLIAATNRIATGETTTDKIIGGVEAVASVTGGALEYAGKVKGAGLVGAIITGVEGIAEVSKAGMSASDKGESVAVAVVDKTAEVGLNLTSNILTVGMAGGATTVLYDRAKENAKEGMALSEKTADMLSGKREFNATELASDYLEMKKKDLIAGAQALEQTTPVQLVENTGKSVKAVYDTEVAYAAVDTAFEPDMTKRKNLTGAQAQLDGRLKELGATRDANGKVDLSKWDNVSKLAQAIDEKKEQLQQKMQESAPSMPRFMQFTQSQAKNRQNFEMAQMELKGFESAGKELNALRQELSSFNEKNAQNKVAALMKDSKLEGLQKVTEGKTTDTVQAPVAMDTTSKSSGMSV